MKKGSFLTMAKLTLQAWLSRTQKGRFTQGKSTDIQFVIVCRGGHLPSLRRQIEADMRRRKVMGVVTTVALKLVLGIGYLEAVIFR
jgi:ATP-dependent helicase YprA (DUF1998 family)